jgi:hypothetical protein
LYAITRLTRKASAAIKYAAFSTSVVLNLNDMREDRIMAYSTNEIYGTLFTKSAAVRKSGSPLLRCVWLTLAE